MRTLKTKMPVDPKVIRDNQIRGHLARAERDRKTAHFAGYHLDFDGADARHKRADSYIALARQLDPNMESPAWSEYSVE